MLPTFHFFPKNNILPMSGLVINSAANKDRSTVNYRHSFAFVRPYLSCNNHYDGWLFEGISFFNQYHFYFLEISLNDLEL